MNDLAKVKNTQVATTPETLLQMAIQQNADIDKLEKLMELQERWEANEARKAYVAAMSAFRGACPAITKTLKAHNSTYAGLAETIDEIKQLLVDNGLSHSWKTSQSDNRVSVTCCVTHIMGHSECTTLEAAPDTTGSKNSIQAVGSTVKYLQRYTLFAILGLASKDHDDDGAGAGKPRITDEQALTLNALVTDNDLPMPKILEWLKQQYKCNSIEELTQEAYPHVVRAVERKIKG